MWERATELDPGHFTSAAYLVQVYESTGDIERAIAMCRLAIDARPSVVKGRHVATIRSKLAELCERSGKDAEALEEYESLLRDYAQAVQLGLEYDPQPPFDSGSPAKAPERVMQLLVEHYLEREAKRAQVAAAGT